jgi:hypothetical protein
LGVHGGVPEALTTHGFPVIVCVIKNIRRRVQKGALMTEKDSNRLLLELEKIRRDVNREIMNPSIPELSVDSIQPVITMAARARLSYLQELIEIAKISPDTPSHEQIAMLARRREAYDELRAAVNALETAINRGYLDVIGA